MKVLVVSNMYPSNDNPGYGVFVKNFENSLSFEGVRIDRAVICGRGRHKLDKAWKYFVFGCKTVWKGLFNSYDCVYVHYIAHSMLPLILLLKLKRIRLVCNAHGEDLLPNSMGERLIFKLVRGTVGKSRMIVVPSEYFAQIARYHFPDNEVFVSPSAGVDLDIFKPLSKATVQPADGALHLGFVSRIDAGKGWDVLLHAVGKLRQTHPDLSFKVTFVGEGAQVPELLQLISELALDEVVSYAGALPQSKLPEFYYSLDIFVFPTVRAAESLGLVGLEALACGIPAICSDIGGIPSYMQDGINGYLFAPGDAEALAQKIIDFSRLNPAQIAAFKAAALVTAQRYGRAKVSSELYSKLVEVVER
jgi:glycosyltransferase involved in cell wall biosynthesis